MHFTDELFQPILCFNKLTSLEEEPPGQDNYLTSAHITCATTVDKTRLRNFKISQNAQI